MQVNTLYCCHHQSSDLLSTPPPKSEMTNAVSAGSQLNSAHTIPNLGVNYPNWVMGPFDLGNGLFVSIGV